MGYRYIYVMNIIKNMLSARESVSNQIIKIRFEMLWLLIIINGVK